MTAFAPTVDSQGTGHVGTIICVFLRAGMIGMAANVIYLARRFFLSTRPKMNYR
jgi:hypothetical protein